MVVLDTEESRFFVSAPAGLVATRVVAVGDDAVALDDFVVVPEVLDGAVAVVVGGRLAAAVVEAVVLVRGLLGELAVPLTAVDVRRAAPVVPEIEVRFFFSSSDWEG
jgi:hypothetical protein